MARPKETLIKPIIRKRADGTIRQTDYYHRATNVPLGSDHAEALRKAAELEGARQVLESPKIPATVFSGLCDSYLDSDDFRRLAPRAQKLNRLYVEKLRKRLGPAQVSGLTTPVLFALKEKLSKELEAASKLPKTKKRSMAKGEEGRMTLSIASHLLNKLSLLMSHALKIGVIRGSNPAFKLGKFRKSDHRGEVWSPEHRAALIDAADPAIRLAAALLLYTAQRPSDVLAMTWSRVTERSDGRIWVALKQRKTAELIAVPAHRDLVEVLRSSPKSDDLLVAAPKGGPWSYRNFARKWDRARRRADYRIARAAFKRGLEKEEILELLIGKQDLQRRDLRRTAMVRMAEAGATISQIAAVSGHGISYCQQIIDRYIPRRGSIAMGAIDAWEAGLTIVTPTILKK